MNKLHLRLRIYIYIFFWVEDKIRVNGYQQVNALPEINARATKEGNRSNKLRAY